MSLERVTTAKTRILVVDDDPDICLALADLLEHEGYHVDVKGTGTEAIEYVRSHPFGAAVLDLGLPDLDGLDVLKAFQEVAPKSPVIILTAYTTAEKTVGALNHGAFAFLTKPYNRDQLKATLKRAIGVQALVARAETVESALTASEDRFRAVVQSATDGIVLADENGRIISWNKAAERLFGFTEQEVLGRPLTHLMPIRYREAHQRGLEHFRATGRSRVLGKTLQMDGLRKDGTEFPIELSLGTWSTHGRVCFSGIIRDVSERKQTEMALRESEERLRMALAAPRVGIWDWNIQTDTVIWSENVESVIGLPRGSFAGTHQAFLELVHPEDRDAVLRAIARALEEGTEYNIEHRVVSPDTTVRWMACHGRVIRNDAGEAIRMLGTVHCITERKKAEEALRFIAEGTATLADREFFRSLVRHLAAALQVRIALITVWKDPSATTARTLAVWKGSVLVENFDYELEGTACHGVIGGEFCSYPEGVQSRFPNDEVLVMMGAESYLGIPLMSSAGTVIGHLAVMDDKPLREEGRAKAIMKIFAARAGAELERLDALETLERTNLQQQLILDSAGEGIYGLDREGKATFVNRAAACMLRWDAAELIGSRMHAILHHSKPNGSPYSAEECPIHSVITDGVTRAGDDAVFWRKDGSSFAVEYVSTPIRECENLVGAVVVFKDITERKQAEHALRESEERFRQVTENIKDVFWMSDPEKNQILYVSPAYEEIWGRTCASLYASPRSWLDAIHPGDRDRVLAAALSKQVPGLYKEEYRIIRPDGSIRWIQDRAFPIRDVSGTVYRIAGIAKDITERKTGI